MNPNQNKRHIKKVIVLTISLVVLAFSATYAYFTSSFDEPNTTTATAGIFNVESTLEVVNSIKNKRMVLIDEEEVAEKADHLEFTVTSKENSTVDGKFDLFLRDMQITRNLKVSDFKWELLKKQANGEEGTEKLTPISSGTFNDVQEASTSSSISSPTDGTVDRTQVALDEIKLTKDTPIELPKNKTVTLVFRLYILNDKERNQIDLTEGSFEGRLYLEAVPVSEINKAQQEVGQP